jgi:hypothetical protein
MALKEALPSDSLAATLDTIPLTPFDYFGGSTCGKP